MRFLAFVLFLTFAGLGLSAAAAPKPIPKKAPAKKSAAKSKRRTTVSRTPAPAASFRQTAPTPERYKEIQGALAAKGYLKSEANGVWDAQSMDALRRYQEDTKEEPTGKLTAASLIGLGLGPKTASLPTAQIKPADVPASPGIDIVPIPPR